MWYYDQGGHRNGPVSQDEIIALFSSGALSQNTLVWRVSMPEWRPIFHVAELAAELQHLGSHSDRTIPALPILPAPSIAIASITCGCISLFGACFGSSISPLGASFGGPILSIPAIITGHIALNTIKKSPQPMDGTGLAKAGLIMGYLMLFTGIIFFISSALSGLSQIH